jgi:hypothetical protein
MEEVAVPGKHQLGTEGGHLTSMCKCSSSKEKAKVARGLWPSHITLKSSSVYRTIYICCYLPSVPPLHRPVLMTPQKIEQMTPQQQMYMIQMQQQYQIQQMQLMQFQQAKGQKGNQMPSLQQVFRSKHPNAPKFLFSTHAIPFTSLPRTPSDALNRNFSSCTTMGIPFLLLHHDGKGGKGKTANKGTGSFNGQPAVPGINMEGTKMKRSDIIFVVYLFAPHLLGL